MTYDVFVFALLLGGRRGIFSTLGVLILEDAGDSSDSGESRSIDGSLLALALAGRPPFG